MAEQAKKVTQSLLVSDKEISLLKSVFSENDEILQLVRNLFFGYELTAEEKLLIKKTFKNDDIRALITSRFLPGFRKDIPVGQYVDLWTGVEVKDKNPDQIYQAVVSRKKLIELTRKALNLLVNPDGEKINLDFDPGYIPGSNDSDLLLQIDLVARNSFISHIETQLIMIKVIAGQKIETTADAKKRLTQNSNK